MYAYDNVDGSLNNTGAAERYQTTFFNMNTNYRLNSSVDTMHLRLEMVDCIRYSECYVVATGISSSRGNSLQTDGGFASEEQGETASGKNLYSAPTQSKQL